MADTTRIWYSADDGEGRHPMDLRGGGWDVTDDFECALIVTDCAEDYFHQHDGWEASWPRTFLIYATEDGPPVARLHVHCESVPQFTAYTEALDG
jgi:hypothetical protein